jgi:hypothetical protein
MTLASHLGPLSPAGSSGCQDGTGPYCTGLYGSSSVLLAPVPHGVSSRPAWPGPVCLSNDLRKPARAASDVLQSKSHLQVATTTKARPILRVCQGVEASIPPSSAPSEGPPAGSTCGPVRYWIWHIGRTPVRPAAEAQGLLQLCSCSCRLWILHPRGTRSPQNTALLTLIVHTGTMYAVFDTCHAVVGPLDHRHKQPRDNPGGRAGDTHVEGPTSGTVISTAP